MQYLAGRRDGHHRWAAQVARDMADGNTGELKLNVRVVDMDISDVVKAANDFTVEYGIKPKSGTPAAEKKKDTAAASVRRSFRLEDTVQFDREAAIKSWTTKRRNGWKPKEPPPPGTTTGAVPVVPAARMKPRMSADGTPWAERNDGPPLRVRPDSPQDVFQHSYG